jgi:hypothetical protein
MVSRTGVEPVTCPLGGAGHRFKYILKAVVLQEFLLENLCRKGFYDF